MYVCGNVTACSLLPPNFTLPEHPLALCLRCSAGGGHAAADLHRAEGARHSAWRLLPVRLPWSVLCALPSFCGIQAVIVMLNPLSLMPR